MADCFVSMESGSGWRMGTTRGGGGAFFLDIVWLGMVVQGAGLV